ncbi:MAG: sulfurtransferase TusA family protein [Polyangiaceae bacterium]|nr:sulfurtransferase TusA family protein [Polyangiaceae bacterium]
MPTTIDARGKSCPLPIVLLAKAARDVAPGMTVVVIADDRAFAADVEAWCRKTQNELVSIRDAGSYIEARVRCGSANGQP